MAREVFSTPDSYLGINLLITERSEMSHRYELAYNGGLNDHVVPQYLTIINHLKASFSKGIDRAI